MTTITTRMDAHGLEFKVVEIVVLHVIIITMMNLAVVQNDVAIVENDQPQQTKVVAARLEVQGVGPRRDPKTKIGVHREQLMIGIAQIVKKENLLVVPAMDLHAQKAVTRRISLLDQKDVVHPLIQLLDQPVKMMMLCQLNM